MKKKFISVALFGAVIIASSSVLSSCKDYDDDISSVQGELHTGLDALNAQYNALNEALEAAKSEAKAAQEAATAAINEAQSTADEGVKAAAEAKAEAELAKQAAAEAKADAIAEAQKLVEEVKKMIPSTDGFVTDETLNAKVEELLAKIAAVDVTDELAALKDQLNGINLDEVSSAIEQMKIQLEAVQKFESLITANQNSITDLQSKYAEINKSIETINTEMEGLAKLSDVTNLEERVKAAEEALKNVEQDVTIVNQNLVTILGKGLRGLVFYPNLFINGIEAAEYGFVRNTVMVDNKNAKLTGTDNEDNAYTLLGNHTNGRAIDYTEGSNTADVNPYVEISYHMNPSNAEVKEAGNVAFISRNAEVIGLRSTEANVGGIAAKGVSTANGKLNVKIQANGAALEKANENGEGTIFAAQVNAGDTVVTSDYALLYPTKIKMEHLAFNDPKYLAEDCNVTGFNDVLFDEPSKAVEFKGGEWNQPEFDNLIHPVQEPLCIPYNEEIDLKKMFQLHYSWDSPTKNATEHAIILPGEESYYGLKYEYNLIKYTIGKNGTSESMYASLNNGVLKPCIVKADGTSDINTQGPSSIGRHPLVQVLVRDTVNNVVVLDGYVQFEIIDVPKYTMTDVFDAKTIKYAPCAGDSKKIYWYQVSDLLYEYSKMSKEEFEETYEIEEVNGQVKQFVWNGTGTPAQGEIANSFREITNTAEQIGTILFNRDVDPDNDGSTTNTFTWNFDGCNTVKIYEMPGRTHTVYVRFARVNNKISSDYRYVYLPIKVSMNDRNEKIGTIGDKIKEYWFSNNRFPAEYAFTRLNVHYPKDNGSTLPFEISLTQVWNGNAINISGLDGTYKAYNPSQGAGHKFFFAPFEGSDNKRKGDSGREYTLSAGSSSMFSVCEGSYNWDATNIGNNDANIGIINEHAVDPNEGVFMNDVVTASYNGVTQNVAKIHHNNGEPYIEFCQTEFAKDLLNGYESQRLNQDGTDGAQLFVNIGVVAYDGCIVKAIQNNINPAYFVRPIDITGVNDVFVDATDNGNKAYVFDLFEFSDWREIKFADQPWYYAFYNIKNVEINENEVMTNLNQGDKNSFVKLSSVTDKLKLTYMGCNTTELDRLHRSYNYQDADKDAINNGYRAAMGYIYYENNMDNIAEFDLRVPVSFTYDWGTITRTVDIHVEKTLNQN